MSLSILTDKTKRPDEPELTNVLGEAKPLWDQLKAYVKETYTNVSEDWKHYGKTSGWTMKLLLKKRNLFFSYPNQGHFFVVFIFGDKAVQAIEKSSCPQHVIDTLRAARKYAEGRGLQLAVKSQEDLDLIKKLLDIKIGT